LTTKD